MGDVGSFNDLMLYFMLFAGVYVLYYAIRGEGKIYENEYPKAIQEEHRKFLRKFCWVIGVGVLSLTALEFAIGQQFPFISWVNIGYVLGCVVVYVILLRKKFGKYIYPQKPGK